MGAQAIFSRAKTQDSPTHITLFLSSHISLLCTMASVSADTIKCSRCNRSGHSAKECCLPFVRTFTRAEMRLKQGEKEAQRRADREAKQAKFEEKKARWEEQQAAKLVQKLAKKGARVEWDAKSDVSEST